MFDFSSVEDFEKHIQLSIPNYSGLCDVFRAFVAENSHQYGSVIDIGCSSGSFVGSLKRIDNVRYIGCDILDIRTNKSFEFHKMDASEFLCGINSADVIISMFTLQFLGRHKRKDVLNEVSRLVSCGAVFLVAEKVFMPSNIESVLKKEHIQQKRKNFTDTEILNKEYDLFGSMHCETNERFALELEKIGVAVPVWQSYNFRAYAVFAK